MQTRPGRTTSTSGRPCHCSLGHSAVLDKWARVLMISILRLARWSVACEHGLCKHQVRLLLHPDASQECCTDPARLPRLNAHLVARPGNRSPASELHARAVRGKEQTSKACAPHDTFVSLRGKLLLLTAAAPAGGSGA